jgi:hypothetical protein
MPLVSITRLHLRSFRYLFAFGWLSAKSARQAQRSAGFLDGWLYAEPMRCTFWTVTVWENEAAMRAYRASGDHRLVMPKLQDWCDEAAVGHWEQLDATVPVADEVLQRMKTIGRPLRLRHPSPTHTEGKTVPNGRLPSGGGPLPRRGA